MARAPLCSGRGSTWKSRRLGQVLFRHPGSRKSVVQLQRLRGGRNYESLAAAELDATRDNAKMD